MHHNSIGEMNDGEELLIMVVYIDNLNITC